MVASPHSRCYAPARIFRWDGAFRFYDGKDTLGNRVKDCIEDGSSCRVQVQFYFQTGVFLRE